MFARLLSLAATTLLLSADLLGKPVEVEFWHGMGSKQGQTVNEIADKFNQSQDKWRVVPVYQGRYNSLSQKLIASCYARRNPAMSQMYPGWTTRFFQYGYLRSAADFIAEDADFRENHLPDYYETMLAENTLLHPQTGEPTLVTIPFNKSVYVLYVNQTRLEELGWTHPPRTWEEFSRLSLEMTVWPEGAAQPTVYGFASRPYIEDFTVQALSAGSQLMNEETGEILIDSPESIAALEFLRSLVTGDGRKRSGYVDTEYLSGPFGSGRIGMFIASTASFPFNDMAVGNRFVWNAYPIPARDENTESMTLMQGTNVGIFSGLSDAENEASWEFVKFLTSPEMTAYWAMATGYMPVRRSVMDIPEFREFMDANERYANAVSTLDRAAYEPRKMYWETVRLVITREVEAFLLGRKSAEEAMAAARRAIEQVQKSSE